jgi:predicted chitinase
MIELTAEGLRQCFPKAPQVVLDKLVERQEELTKHGVNHTRPRLSYALANVEHETDGFTIPNLTESINYSAERAAEIFPKRAGATAAEVRAKYGTARGWQVKMFDDVYGGRMGNRPGTSDGSDYLGRGGPQVTGREGYEQVAKYSGVPIDVTPQLACAPEHQAAIIGGFIDWKKLNAKADAGDFKGYVRIWNGGQIGIKDREARLAGNDPYLARMKNVDRIMPVAKALPGAPPTPVPPPEVIAEATTEARKARAAGATVAAGGTGNEVAKTATTAQPDKPSVFLPSVAAWTIAGVGIAVLVIGVVLVIRRTKQAHANWF